MFFIGVCLGKIFETLEYNTVIVFYNMMLSV